MRKTTIEPHYADCDRFYRSRKSEKPKSSSLTWGNILILALLLFSVIYQRHELNEMNSKLYNAKIEAAGNLHGMGFWESQFQGCQQAFTDAMRELDDLHARVRCANSTICMRVCDARTRRFACACDAAPIRKLMDGGWDE